MNPNRRGLVGLFTAAAAGFGLQSPTAEAATKAPEASSDKKPFGVSCLYHCDFGDPARFSQVLTNVSNHYGAYGSQPIRIIIVTHSQAVKFFLNDLTGTPWEKETIDPEIYNRFVKLTENGLHANLCRVTFKRLNLDPAKARSAPFLSFVESGVATVADLQARGYSYIKVG